MNIGRKKGKFGIIALTAVLLISFSGCNSGNKRPIKNPEPSSSTVSEIEPENINQPTEQQDFLMYVTGVVETVSLKTSDDDGGEVLEKLPVQAEVKLIDDESMTCYYVDYDGTKGYIKKEFLTAEKKAACKRENSYISRDTSLYDVNDNVDAAEIRKINKNDRIYITAKTSGDYWFVYHESSKQFGFVLTKDIADAPEVSSKETETVVSAAPVPTPAPTDNRLIGKGNPPKDYTVYYVSGVDNFLGVRNAKAYDSSNEIGKMYEGETIYVVDSTTGTYWYVYSPKLGIYGYSNHNYLSRNKPNNSSSKAVSSKPEKEYPVGYSENGPAKGYTSYYVSGVTNFLGIRDEQSSNAKILGQAYEGDEIRVLDKNTGSKYWYVYSPTSKMYGFADSGYLSGSAPVVSSVSSVSSESGGNSGDDYTVYTVTGTSNYLGLRSAPSYDESNVIAKLNNGDKVHVYSTAATGDYWYVFSPANNTWGYVNYKYLK